MPEDVSDLFETRSAAHHGCGKRVPQDVSASAWSADSRLPQQELVVMLDGDEAGRLASQKLAARLWKRLSPSMVEVPSGRQPDQLLTEESERILSRASGAPGVP